MELNGIEYPESSEYRKEMRKWDAPKRQGGMNANGYEEFPRMVYMAQLNPLSGKYQAMAHRDVLSLDQTMVIFDAEAFNRTCQRTVRDGNEYERAKAEGWRDSAPEAMAYHEEQLAKDRLATAERNYADRNMSQKAQAEAAKADAATAEFLPEVPEKPRAKRKYTRKASAPAA